ncbi:MAG: hypothetical protein IKH07_03525 [Oscillospiraceae bacterium]|nr:hypothetical protein [Oscillospiraceae bacterium]
MNNPTKAAAKPAGRTGIRVRIILILIALLLILLLAAWMIFPKVVNPDRVVRFFRYMGLRDKEGYGRIAFEGGAGNVYAGFDDGLLVGTEGGLTLYSLEGEQKAFIQGALPTPILRTGGDVSLLFSPGSSYACGVGSGGSTLTDGAMSGSFIDASVSDDGYTAYLTAESGCKAMATVLNQDQAPIYRFSSRTRYLNACAVSEKGACLAAASLEEQNSIYRSGVTILRTDEPLADLESDESSAVRVDMGNQVVYELRFLDRSHLMAVAQDEIVFLNTEGERLTELALEPGELIDFSVSTEGWLILALSRGGGGSRILTLNAEGERLGEQELPDRVRSVSAAGKYAAVLTDMYLQTYDRRLNPYEHSVEIQAATRVIVRTDGTALLIGSGGTKLFIP